MPAGPARARDPETRALGEPLALVREERRVGGDDDDDRSRAGPAARPPAERPAHGLGTSSDADLLADRHAIDPQPRPLAVVRLDQDPDRVPAAVVGDDPRRRPDPALELVADHPRPATDVALGDGSAGRRGQRRAQVLAAHVEAVDVVEQPVVRLADDRQRPVLARASARSTETATSSSRTTPTLCVLVIATGVVSMPDSRTHSSPVISPLPLSRWQPA